MDGSLHALMARDGDNGHSQGQRALVVTTVLTAISTVIVAMRLYARLGLMKITGREDWAILISLVFALVYLALVAAREFKVWL
jgi:type IV secretory pathway VirB2 component (pilin)